MAAPAKLVENSIDFMWLAQGHTPDHTTLSEFRSKHSAGLKDLFRHILRVAMVGGFLDLIDVGIDGTRIKANSSRYQTWTAERIAKALEELAKLMPSDAHKLMPDGSVKDVPLGELAVNDKVLIKPGEKIPADGVIVAGESSVNEAMLTGESTPAPKKTGAKVIGGAINGEGSLTIEVKGTGKDSFLSQVIDLVKQAQESKSKTQDLANTAALWLTIIALGGGAITLLVWLAFMGKDFAFAIERTVTVMVIACPHALGLAVPLVVAVSTALAAKNGLLIRDRVAFEGARKLKAIIFDKTGTLTEGRFGVTDTLILSPDINEETLRTYAASVDANSEHPIAKAIAASSDKKLPVEGFKSITGKGAEGRVDGKDIKVVSPGYLREQNIAFQVNPAQVAARADVDILVEDSTALREERAVANFRRGVTLGEHPH